MFDWDEGDRFSFEDSDRFEEDSLCSWISEPESLCNNWRGWKKQNGSGNGGHPCHASHGRTKEGQVLSLVELAAREVAGHIPFEVVEHVYPPVPEQLQLRIAFWSFPENEEDIRLYSCLANGSAEEFQRGEHLFKARGVKDLLQIGFHLSATVTTPQTIPLSKGSYNVAVTFDRGRITSCNCSCSSTASWCSHVVAVCLHRIHLPTQVRLRAPVSESLSRLHRDQLQKFAQYLISELPQQILPTAQRLLDELLSSQQTAINTLRGAPDPTAGASVQEQTTWCLDEATLHENIRKILIKLCVPSPMVFSDVNYLSSTAPPAAAEWSSLLRPLRGREPEGMWNLLSIVREMFRRSDRNAIPLLEILTEEVLACDQILAWWFNTKVSLHTGSGSHAGRSSVHSNAHASQHACSSLCDEIVILWRLAALNPALSPQDRQAFFAQLREWHGKTLDRVWKVRNGSGSAVGSIRSYGCRAGDADVFTGFKPAMEACLLDWSDYPIPGVTFAEGGAHRWYSPYAHARTVDHVVSSSFVESGESGYTCGHVWRGRSVDIGQSYGARIPLEKKTLHSHMIQSSHAYVLGSGSAKNDSNRSSLSSEGFCENENDIAEVMDDSNHRSLQPCLVVVAGTSASVACSDSDELLQAAAGPAGPGPEISKKTDSGDLLASGTYGAPKLPNKSRVDSTDESKPAHAEKRSPRHDEMRILGISIGPHCSHQSKASRSQQEKKRDAESQPSSDEYQLYYYDPQARIPSPESSREYKMDEGRFPIQVKIIDDPLEVLFARAEALHAHGHTQEACKLAVQLAEELLVNPPNLMVELPPPPNRGKRARKFNPASHQISLQASSTLAKAAFLCSVLGENMMHHHLAFRVGLFGLELARPPASTKALEVKLANQEQDLVTLLKRIPLSEAELEVIRERAEQLRQGQLLSRGEALLPLMLASYIFDALVLSGCPGRGGPQAAGKLPSDETLGFDSAVSALGLKANVSEAEHPLLCEGTRRQRGDLSITLLVHYKDDQEKLAKIMDKLLDKDVHQMCKANTYYVRVGGPNAPDAAQSQITCKEKGEEPENVPASKAAEDMETIEVPNIVDPTVADCDCQLDQQVSAAVVDDSKDPEGGVQEKEISRHSHNRMSDDAGDHSEGASSPGWEEDYKAWEAKFRCTNLRTTKKHSAGMASIDSSAPETTSSDNSPTVVRRSTWVRPGGPGSDSGSSGESSDSFVSSSSGDKAVGPKPRDVEGSLQGLLNSRFPVSLFACETVPRPPAPCPKPARFKGKRTYPNVPNQPSEASAHFMFELAKTVLTKAGGNSSTAVLFTQPSASQNHRGPHRALHMCAFQIGLYALGLHNAVSPNWLSRTYSSHVSWITGQAVEVGSTAINFLIDTWEGHLTPTEVASLADRASRGRDPTMVRTAAELALSCLPHAPALNPNEIQRALIQCKEQSGEMLERACLSVESAAKGGGVSPEVLFDVARRWYELYDESLQDGRTRSPEVHSCNLESEANQNLSHTEAGTGTPLSDTSSLSDCSLSVSHMETPITTAPSVQILTSLPCHPMSYALTYPAAPYGYLQGIPAFPHPPVPLHPAYIPPAPAYTYPPLPTTPYYASAVSACHLRQPTTGIYSAPMLGVPVSQAALNQTRTVLPLTVQPVATMPQPVIPQSQQAQVHGQVSQLNQRQLGYLLSAYRVGMLAMETLARRVHDDRPQAKYARNPPYGEDVKWLLGVAKKLGTSYLQEFCICTVNSVASPFVLHEIVLEAAHYLARSGTGPLVQPLRSHLLTPLIQKCQQMFIACTHFKMYHITPAEYDEFVNIVRSARSAFQLTPGGMVQFNELLQSLRRSKSCKKDLWQRIASALAMASI